MYGLTPVKRCNEVSEGPAAGVNKAELYDASESMDERTDGRTDGRIDGWMDGSRMSGEAGELIELYARRDQAE